MNRLNGIPSCETFLSPANFFRNSWLTRHSAGIMSRLRRDHPRFVLHSPDIFLSFVAVAYARLTRRPARSPEILLISTVESALKRYERSFNYRGSPDVQTNERTVKEIDYIPNESGERLTRSQRVLARAIINLAAVDEIRCALINRGAAPTTESINRVSHN